MIDFIIVIGIVYLTGMAMEAVINYAIAVYKNN